MLSDFNFLDFFYNYYNYTIYIYIYIYIDDKYMTLI